MNANRLAQNQSKERGSSERNKPSSKLSKNQQIDRFGQQQQQQQQQQSGSILFSPSFVLDGYNIVVKIHQLFPVSTHSETFSYNSTLQRLLTILPLPTYCWSLCLSRFGNINTLKEKQQNIMFSGSTIRWYLLNRLRIQECRDHTHVLFRILFDKDHIVVPVASAETDQKRKPRRRTLSLSQPNLHPPSEDSFKQLTHNHIKPLVAEVARVHPGLKFLWEIENIIPYYVSFVTLCIFRQAQAHGKGLQSSHAEIMNITQLQRCGLESTLELVSKLKDIDENDTVFSHRNFYVILRKFCELDEDCDGLLSREDLLRISWDLSISSSELPNTNQGISFVIANRIAHMHYIPLDKQLITPSPDLLDFSYNPCVTFSDFCNLFLSEIDTCHPSSLHFWFSVFDDENFGMITDNEVTTYYGDIQDQFYETDDPAISFNDFINESFHMFSLVNPELGFKLTRSQMLKRTDQANTFFSAMKCIRGYYMFECDDHIISIKERQRRKASKPRAYQQRFVFGGGSGREEKWETSRLSEEFCSFCNHEFEQYSMLGNHDVIEKVVLNPPRQGIDPPFASSTPIHQSVTIELEGERKQSVVMLKRVKDILDSFLFPIKRAGKKASQANNKSSAVSPVTSSPVVSFSPTVSSPSSPVSSVPSSPVLSSSSSSSKITTSPERFVIIRSHTHPSLHHFATFTSDDIGAITENEDSCWVPSRKKVEEENSSLPRRRTEESLSMFRSNKQKPQKKNKAIL